MYEIYINQTKLILKSSESLQNDVPVEGLQRINYDGSKEQMKNVIRLCEEAAVENTLLYVYHDVEKLRTDFTARYKTIKACGGVVVNEYGELLAIYRRGTWDLPKGKMEKGETKEGTACREVIEETGISDVEMDRYLHKTEHTFTNRNDVRVLKQSYWYIMKAEKQDLVPQEEEDIEVAEWLTIESLEAKENIYASILAVLQKYKEHTDDVK